MFGCRVAVPLWVDQDGITEMFTFELSRAGYEPVCFDYRSSVPENIDVLLTFGPYDKILPMWECAAVEKSSRRPVIIHWNTEGMPDINIPFPIVRWLGSVRSWVGRLSHSNSGMMRKLSTLPPILWVDKHMHRFRYLGDYEYAYKKGWLDVLGDSSLIYSRIRSQGSTPTVYAPWGGSKVLYNNLELERDIDVIWIGNRGSKRRSQILDRVFDELQPYGVKMHIADNVLNPFIFNGERIKYLNRSKIILNITRTWYDDNFSRFALAAPNRAMILSEPMLQHCSEFIPNIHYISSPISEISKNILYYLEHDEERQRIVENAYQLITGELQFLHSLKKMLIMVEDNMQTSDMKV